MAIAMTFSFAACSNEIVITRAFEAKELMRINNSSCYLPEMMLYLTTVQNKYEEVYGEELWNQAEDGVSLEDRVKDNVLAKVAQVKVMNLMAESYDLALTDDEKAHIQETATKFYESLNDTERTLIGVTEEDIYNIYCEYALANDVYDYVIKDVNPEISDDEARTVTVEQILIKTYALDSEGNKVEYTERAKSDAKEKAETVRELALDENTSFESLAAEYNEADEMTCTFGRGEKDQVFEDTAFSLDTDEVSEVVETQYGYLILKCISDFDVEETQLNKTSILEARKEQVFDDTYDEFLTTLTKTLNEKLYTSIEMIHDPNVKTTGFFDVDF